jgi:hypothetical protein
MELVRTSLVWWNATQWRSLRTTAIDDFNLYQKFQKSPLFVPRNFDIPYGTACAKASRPQQKDCDRKVCDRVFHNGADGISISLEYDSVYIGI